MNAIHLHLVFNHFPVSGLILANIILIYAMIKKKEDLTRFSLIFVAIMGFVYRMEQVNNPIELRAQS